MKTIPWPPSLDTAHEGARFLAFDRDLGWQWLDGPNWPLGYRIVLAREMIENVAPETFNSLITEWLEKHNAT